MQNESVMEGEAGLPGLRVAVLVDGPMVSRAVRDLIAFLQTQPGVSLQGVWYPAGRGPQGNALAARCRRVVWRLDARLARLSPAHDPGRGLCRVGAQALVPEESGVGDGRRRLRVAGRQLPAFDLLIRAGARAPGMVQALASRARFGAIGFDFSLSAPPDEGGLGFHETLAGEDHAGLVLYAESPVLASPWVIRRGWFQPHWSVVRTRGLLMAAAGRMMKDAVLACVAWHQGPAGAADDAPALAGQALMEAVWPKPVQSAHDGSRVLSRQPRLDPGRVRPVPVLSVLGYLFRTGQRILSKALDGRRGRGYTWQLGFLRPGRPGEQDFSQVVPAVAPGRRFQADPCLVMPAAPGQKPVVFIEEWAPRRRRGHISALEVADVGESVVRLRHLGKVIRTEHHLSFPYHFRWGGHDYLVPECMGSGRITVWRARKFPFDWMPVATLMDNVCAVDTLLFEAKGRWWMLTNLDRTGSTLVQPSRDFHSELHLFHADNPLSSDWTPHPMNPVRIDSRGGRNAGLVIREGEIFRYGQIQAFDCYGRGMAIYRITALSPSCYGEELVQEILPGDLGGLSGVHGLHSLSQAGDLAVIDLLHRGGLGRRPA